ncbi:leucine-rich repeat domain-containing protein [bacterium]|nr:MAG: leucine-rich repeat domain-containing protein [bacterium]
MIFGKPKFYASLEEAEAAPGINKVRRLAVHDLDIGASVERIVRFCHLEELYFAWNRSATELPVELLFLKRLKVFSVLNNPLKEIPEWLCELNHLEKLEIRGTNIVEVPSCIEKLSNLRYLELANNRLLHIPSQIGRLPRLRTLNLSENPIEIVPDEILMSPSIKTLDLLGTALPEAEVKRIKSLYPMSAVSSGYIEPSTRFYR